MSPPDFRQMTQNSTAAADKLRECFEQLKAGSGDVPVEVFSGLSDEESMRDVGFLIEKVLGEKGVRSAILDGVLIFYAGPSDQHEHVVGPITRSVWNSLQSVSAPFADAVGDSGTSGVRIVGGEMQPDASWRPFGRTLRTKPTVVLEVGCLQ
jgi:hypothetical protein